MKQHTRSITHAAILGAVYFALTHMQNILLPGSATWAVQCRLSEALCVFALFTPAAAPGLTVGCFLFNLTYAGALPLDIVVGSLATWLACRAMERLRSVTVRGIPLLALTMPALFNGLLVGWELTVYIGDTGLTLAAFALNFALVALGELIVLLIPGLAIWKVLKLRRLDREIFG